MKKLAYKVVFRLNSEEYNEKIYNDGFVIVYFNEKNEFIRMEGVLTLDYLIAEIVKDNLILTIYSSNVIQDILSTKDTIKLSFCKKNLLDIFWEDSVEISEVEFPFDFEFVKKYTINDEEKEEDYCSNMIQVQDNIVDEKYYVETVQLTAIESIPYDEFEKYAEQLKRFKRVNVLSDGEWV